MLIGHIAMSWDHADCPQPFQMNYFVEINIIILFRKHLLEHESYHIVFRSFSPTFILLYTLYYCYKTLLYYSSYFTTICDINYDNVYDFIYSVRFYLQCLHSYIF